MSKETAELSFLVNVGAMDLYLKGENLFLRTLLLPTEAVEYETGRLFRIQQEFTEVQTNVAIEFKVPILKIGEAKGSISFLDGDIEYIGVPFVSDKGTTTRCFQYLLERFNIGNSLVTNLYNPNIFYPLLPGKHSSPYRRIRKTLKSGKKVEIRSYILTGRPSDSDIFFTSDASWKTCTGNGNKEDFTLMNSISFYNCLINREPLSSKDSEDSEDAD